MLSDAVAFEMLFYRSYTFMPAFVQLFITFLQATQSLKPLEETLLHH
jgi:hypothetical protein